MKQDRQHLFMLAKVVARGLVGADLAEHDGVDGFQMRGVGDKAHMHLDAVELAVGAGAEMIFDVARSADIIGAGLNRRRKFVEDDAVGLGHHIGEDVQPAAMRHAVDDFAHAIATRHI